MGYAGRGQWRTAEDMEGDMEMGSLSSAGSGEMENVERRGHGLQKEA